MFAAAVFVIGCGGGSSDRSSDARAERPSQAAVAPPQDAHNGTGYRSRKPVAKAKAKGSEHATEGQPESKRRHSAATGPALVRRIARELTSAGSHRGGAGVKATVRRILRQAERGVPPQVAEAGVVRELLNEARAK